MSISAESTILINLQYDLQAQDRAFRIGQTRDVEVFRLVSTGTIEEIIYARQIYKQQQANIGYTASNERRYFAGVQENAAKKGEIFGLTNIFSYQGENVVLRDIVNKTNVAESRAGVAVVGLDLDSAAGDAEDDPLRVDNPDASADDAMSQLAALVAESDDKKKRKRSRGTDAVNAILASAGVEYTHENSEVIGTSKVEEQLSRRALEAGDDIDMRGEKVFAGSQSAHLSDGEMGNADDDDGIHGNATERKVTYRYHPPEDVRRRQFCSMAKHFGFEDVAEFALMVETWTQAQRRACLERFYRERRAAKLGGE